MYKVKLKPSGEIDRFKARLATKGYNQIEGIDYKDSFLPVAKMGIVWMFIVIATTRAWPIFQPNVSNVFLYGFLYEEVYMTPPLGYQKALAKQLCLLKWTLNGLKQASR